MMCLVKFACALILAALVFGSLDASAQHLSIQIDAAKITDPVAKTAVQELLKKDAATKEVTIEDQKTTYEAGGKLFDSEQGKVMKRAPYFYFRQSKHPNGQAVGTLFDSKNRWEIVVNSPQKIAQTAESLKAANAPQTMIDSKVAEMKTEHSKVDLDKLKAAGVFEKYFIRSQLFSNPMAIVDPATLKLVSENADDWNFKASSRKLPPEMKAMEMTLVFDKHNGQCTRFKMQSGDMVTITTMDKITVNPKTPIVDATFKYTPPAKAIVNDDTNRIIHEFSLLE